MFAEVLRQTFTVKAEGRLIVYLVFFQLDFMKVAWKMVAEGGLQACHRT